MPRQTRPPEPDEEVEEIEIADEDLCTCGERFDEHEQVDDEYTLSGPCQHPDCDCECFEPVDEADEEEDDEEDETAEDYPEPDPDAEDSE